MQINAARVTDEGCEGRSEDVKNGSAGDTSDLRYIVEGEKFRAILTFLMITCRVKFFCMHNNF